MVVSEQGNSFPFAKWTCYDKGLQSGMVVRWPGKVKAEVQTDAMVEYVDVLPTFLDAAGLPIPDDLDGRSFLPCSWATLPRTKQSALDCKPVEAFTMDPSTTAYAPHAQTDSATSGTSHPRHPSGIP